jgi:hypothetical protein
MPISLGERIDGDTNKFQIAGKKWRHIVRVYYAGHYNVEVEIVECVGFLQSSDVYSDVRRVDDKESISDMAESITDDLIDRMKSREEARKISISVDIE